MKSDAAELKSCPFCGYYPTTEIRVTQMGGGEDHIDFSVICGECGISKTVRLKIRGTATFIDAEKAMADVIKAWNTRGGEEGAE